MGMPLKGVDAKGYVYVVFILPYLYIIKKQVYFGIGVSFHISFDLK